MRVNAAAAALLALGSAACATPRWEEFASTDDADGIQMFLIDAAAIKRRGNIVHGRQMIVYERTHDVTLSKFDVDCHLRQTRFKQTIVVRAGRNLSTDRSAGSWSASSGGSVGTALVDKVCTRLSGGQ